MTEIKDSFGRSFKTLRISLLNACNFKCNYCVDPDSRKAELPQGNTLSSQQLLSIVKDLHSILNLDVIRLTGGEPTLYNGLLSFTEGVAALGVPSIKMTSNGYFLKEKAGDLAKAGLKSVNISMDAISEDVFTSISKRTNVRRVMEGIDACLKHGIEVKINSVIMKGKNEGEIIKLIRFCGERKISIRFLEVMKMGHLFGRNDLFFSQKDMLEVIQKEFELIPLIRSNNATARYWTTPQGYKVGIIANESEPFCTDCNRLRLDSHGKIYGCISSSKGIDVYSKTRKELSWLLKEALLEKRSKFFGSPVSMLHLGG